MEVPSKWEDWAEIYSRRGRSPEIPYACTVRASKPIDSGRLHHIRSEHSLAHITYYLLPIHAPEQDDGDEEFTKSSKDETNGQQ